MVSSCPIFPVYRCSSDHKQLRFLLRHFIRQQESSEQRTLCSRSLSTRPHGLKLFLSFETQNVSPGPCRAGVHEGHRAYNSTVACKYISSSMCLGAPSGEYRAAVNTEVLTPGCSAGPRPRQAHLQLQARPGLS